MSNLVQAYTPQADMPIGVFDSGIGGLTVVNALKQQLPHESFLYYGDTAHLPYGDKSPETLRGYVRHITDFLLSSQVKAIVIACNTASAVAGQEVREQCGAIPVFEVIQPAVHEAIAASKLGRIGVIGTKTTIESHVYLIQLLKHNPQALVLEKSTPLLVPMIEEGWLDNELSHKVVEAYMSDTGFRGIDTLILGCTHYPLLRKTIEQYFLTHSAQPVSLIDSSSAVARAVDAGLRTAGLLSFKSEEKRPDRFFVSDLTTAFAQAAVRFFGHDVELVKLPLPVVEN
jgi:glutamate racemase